MLLARRMLLRRGRADLARAVWAMPLYWLLASVAAWRAVIELVTAPHRWAKTPHEPHDGKDPGDQGASAQTSGVNHRGRRRLERVKGIEPSS
jgi:hypothetical protein